MVAAGIVDPAKVTRSALENAASVAAMVLTTESLVADKPEPPAPAAPAAARHGRHVLSNSRKALKLLDFFECAKADLRQTYAT